MSTFFSFIEFEFSSSCYYFFLMKKIIIKHLVKVKNLRLVIYECKHIHTECILKLCMFVKKVKYNIRIGVSSYVNTNPYSFHVGLISYIYNSVDFLVFDEFSYFLDKQSLIDHIWKFFNNDF